MIMRALSLWQPYATAIAIGLKGNETRKWPSKYAGPIAIHAAQFKHGRDSEGNVWDLYDFWRKMAVEDLAVFARAGYETWRDLPFGAVVCTATQTGCLSSEFIRPSLSELEQRWGDYRDNRFAHKLANVVKLGEPIPVKGKQGYFNVELPDQILHGPEVALKANRSEELSRPQ